MLTINSSYHYLMQNFTYTFIANNSLSHVSHFLSVSFKTSLWVMNNSYLLHLPIMAFFFINLSFVGLLYAIHESHVSIPDAHPWETGLHFNVHGNLAPHHDLAPLIILSLLGLFSGLFVWAFMGLFGAIYHLCFNYERDPSLLHMQKGSKYTHPRPCSNYKMKLNNLVTFATHHHKL